MSMIYYEDPNTGLWQPERRQGGEPPESNRRQHATRRTTSEQYAFLRDWLLRREDLQAKVAKRGRTIRHVLAILSLVYVALFFSQPDFVLSLSALGLEQEITLQQLGAVAPLVISYLVLHAAHVGLTRLKIIHECVVIERELQRFGMETSYKLLSDWKQYCNDNRHLKSHFLSIGSLKLIYGLYDLFLTVAVLVSFYVSGVLAFQAYQQAYTTHPHTITIFLGFLSLGATTSVVSILALRYCRKHLDEFLNSYLAERATVSDSASVADGGLSNHHHFSSRGATLSTHPPSTP